VWTERAAKSLTVFCSYIELDSPSAAKRVRKEIVKTAAKLSLHAEIYQLDEVLADPELNIRRFFRWNYKVVYQVHEKEVIILNIFHTRQSL
jgi:plasmid stabilization system protein ParE